MSTGAMVDVAAIAVIAGLTRTVLAQRGRLRAVERLALVDELTGLANFRAFRRSLGRHDALYQRHGAPVALVVLDLDHFKALNDDHGHVAGNHALARVGDILRQHLRAGDVAARIGGDEFAVIAPGADEAEARTLLGRMLTALADAGLEASGGVSARSGADSLWEAWTEADDRARAAKRSRRDTRAVGRCVSGPA